MPAADADVGATIGRVLRHLSQHRSLKPQPLGLALQLLEPLDERNVVGVRHHHASALSTIGVDGIELDGR